MLPVCSLCKTSVDLAPGIARGRAGVWHNADSDTYLCLGHAAVMRCDCGWEVISCSIAGCGNWRPINDQTKYLGEYIWNVTHEPDEGDDE